MTIWQLLGKQIPCFTQWGERLHVLRALTAIAPSNAQVFQGRHDYVVAAKYFTLAVYEYCVVQNI